MRTEWNVAYIPIDFSLMLQFHFDFNIPHIRSGMAESPDLLAVLVVSHRLGRPDLGSILGEDRRGDEQIVLFPGRMRAEQ